MDLDGRSGAHGPRRWDPRKIVRGLARHRDSLAVPLMILLGKVTAFLFDAVLGARYGAGKISDAFIMAHSIPVLLFEGISTALISCYIPVYSSLRHGHPERIDRFNSGLAGIAFLLSCAITLFFSVFCPGIDRIYARGFDSESLALMDRYAAIMAWSIPSTGAYCILRGYLQIVGRKTISALGQTVQYLVLILAVLLLYPHDLALAWATPAGNALCLAVFCAAALRSGFRYRPCLPLRDQEIRTVGWMILPIFFSTLSSELATFVDRSFASGYEDGVVTSMTYGYQLSFAFQGIVSSALLILAFPRLADLAARVDLEGLSVMVRRCADGIVWVAAPLVVGGMILAGPLNALMYGHGSFDQESVSRTALVFAGYMPGVLFASLKHLADKTCYALQRTDHAMRASFLMTGVNIVLDIILDRVWGYRGLVAATDIAIFLCVVSELILIRREIPGFSLRAFASGLMPPLILSAVMGAAVLAVRGAVVRWSSPDGSSVRLLALCIGTGAAVYCGSALLLFRDRLKDDLTVFLDQDPR